MRKRVILLLSATPVLASCFGDDPDNTPLYGQWEMATEIDSVTFDGMILPLEGMPPEFAAIQGSESRCGEPRFIDADWQQEDINRRVMGQCTMDSYDVTPTRVDGTGTCRIGQGNLTSTPRLTVGIDQAEESYRMVVSMEGSAVDPQTGQPHSFKLIAVQEGTRVGDCKADCRSIALAGGHLLVIFEPDRRAGTVPRGLEGKFNASCSRHAACRGPSSFSLR